MNMILYVCKSEPTSLVKLVHFNDPKCPEIPSELEANAKILDEAFPELTIDLIIVPERFEPSSVHALSKNLNIPTSLMFIGCPRDGGWHVGEFGVRIIAR